MNPYEAITLGNLANGAAEEIFKRELSRVLLNIADVNTDSKAVRQISLTVKFLPTEQRDGAVMAVLSSTKLAPPIVASVPLHIGRDGDGRHVAVQTRVQQEDIFGFHAAAAQAIVGAEVGSGDPPESQGGL